MKEAIYTFSQLSMDIVIPKKKGDGYLKSCFGYHTTNAAAEIFEANRPKWFTNGDCTDIDGYLAIELTKHWWDKDFKKGVQETIEALEICFPHIEKFTEDRERFYRIVLNKH